MNALLFAAAIVGCNFGGYGYANRGYSYNTGYSYTPTYNYTPQVQYVQQAVYVPYVEKVKFVAVEQAPPAYYAALAAAPLRAEERYQEYRAQQSQQTIISTQPLAQPQQAVYQQQQYQDPVTPTKGIPQQSTYAAPQSFARSTPQQPVTYSDPQVPVKSEPQTYSQPYAPEKSAPSGQAFGDYLNTPDKIPPPPDTQIPATGQMDTGVPLPPPISEHGLIYGAMGADEPQFSPPAIRTAYPTPSRPIRQSYSLDPNMVRVLSKNCATCHTGARSKGGAILFDSPGQLAQLDLNQLQEMYDQVLLGQQHPGRQGMPQKRTMSGSEAAVILNGLGGYLRSMASR